MQKPEKIWLINGKLIFLAFSLILLAGCSYTATQTSSSRPSPRGGIKTLIFGEPATLTGRLEQIKTYDENGRAVFPYFLNTESKIMVKPAFDFDPGDTNEVINGIEVKIIGQPDAVLDQFKNQKVTIKGQVATGVNLYCFNFALFVNSPRDIIIYQQ